MYCVTADPLSLACLCRLFLRDPFQIASGFKLLCHTEALARRLGSRCVSSLDSTSQTVLPSFVDAAHFQVRFSTFASLIGTLGSFTLAADKVSTNNRLASRCILQPRLNSQPASRSFSCPVRLGNVRFVSWCSECEHQ